MRIDWLIGNITNCDEVDAIVNAANPALLGGGGVDHAIHKVAGWELKEACRALPELEPDIRCYPGDAKTTSGFKLPVPYVIHTVGPIFPYGREPHYPGEIKYSNSQDAQLVVASCIRNCLGEAIRLQLRSIAFPAISCGNYGCSPSIFGNVIKQVLRERIWDLDVIQIVLFSEEEFDLFKSGWLCR